MKEYLKETEVIDYSNSDIKKLAKELSKNCKDDVEIARNCFLFVRDKVKHTGDCKDNITTYNEMINNFPDIEKNEINSLK